MTVQELEAKLFRGVPKDARVVIDYGYYGDDFVECDNFIEEEENVTQVYYKEKENELHLRIYGSSPLGEYKIL